MENEVDISKYEIALMEPLHDFKNVINRVLKELPHSTEEKELKVMLTNLLSDIEGKHYQFDITDIAVNALEKIRCIKIFSNLAAYLILYSL